LGIFTKSADSHSSFAFTFNMGTRMLFWALSCVLSLRPTLF
jgi:hypothetical protein